MPSPALPPLAELHVHVEGTLQPELALALAERNRVPLPYRDPDELRARYRFRDLRSFLDLYYANLVVLRTEADFAELTATYLRRAAAAGVRHTEVFVDPQAHTTRGVPLEVVLTGVTAALESAGGELGLSSGLIVCFLRDLGPDAAMATLDAVLESGIPVLGVGLDSAEVGFPPGPFAAVFAKARAAGLARVAHAGEEGPAGYVWDALRLLEVARIDHGIRSLEDRTLVERLVAGRVPLTVCPLSNVRLQVVPSVADLALVDMLDAGLVATINSDDPAYFGGYIDDNFAAVIDAHGLSAAQVATLARNSFEAAFLEPGRRARLLADVDAWEKAAAAG